MGRKTGGRAGLPAPLWEKKRAACFGGAARVGLFAPVGLFVGDDDAEGFELLGVVGEGDLGKGEVFADPGFEVG